MIFTTVAFFAFLVVVLIVLRFIKNRNAQQIFLLFASYFFYGFWDVRFLGLMIAQTLICYAGAMIMKKNDGNEKIRKATCISVSVIALSILFVFKYLGFALSNIGVLIPELSHVEMNIILPIGISFYTFQAMSYSIDVYRRMLTANTSFLKVSLYISFFPQLVAGPIVRATDFLPQLEEDHEIKWSNIVDGAQIFLFGFIKKKVFADTLAVFVDPVFAAPGACDSFTAALAVIGFCIQVYFDFSGYSDMAIGVAKMMGYSLCKNFDMPYVASSITEFWNRWHISLSQWFRDYVYIPLGGNRRGVFRTCLNLIIIMTLCGIWHGANWTYILWGTLQGVGFVVNRIYRKIRHIDKKTYIPPLKRIVSWVVTMVFVMISMALFRSNSIEDFGILMKNIFSFSSIGIHHPYVYVFVAVAVTVICNVIAIVKNNRRGYYPLLDMTKLSSKVILSAVLWFAILFAFSGNSPFVYFQF